MYESRDNDIYDVFFTFTPFKLVWSLDDREKDMGQYFPFNIVSVIYRELHDLYDITMVPKLVILAPSGDLITSTGRKELQVNTCRPHYNKIISKIVTKCHEFFTGS